MPCRFLPSVAYCFCKTGPPPVERHSAINSYIGNCLGDWGGEAASCLALFDRCHRGAARSEPGMASRALRARPLAAVLQSEDPEARGARRRTVRGCHRPPSWAPESTEGLRGSARPWTLAGTERARCTAGSDLTAQPHHCWRVRHRLRRLEHHEEQRDQRRPVATRPRVSTSCESALVFGFVPGAGETGARRWLTTSSAAARRRSRTPAPEMPNRTSDQPIHMVPSSG